jgi:hypothetical protein
MENTRFRTDKNILSHPTAQQPDGFYDYYHILRSSSADDDESEESGSSDTGELKGYMDGLHSPFGIIGQIREKTGYSLDYILWAEPWITFIIESADAPRYVKGSRPTPVIESAEEAANALGGKIEVM